MTSLRCLDGGLAVLAVVLAGCGNAPSSPPCATSCVGGAGAGAAGSGGGGGALGFVCPLDTGDPPRATGVSVMDDLVMVTLSNGWLLCWGEDYNGRCGRYDFMPTPLYVNGPSCLKSAELGAPMAAGITWDDRVMVWGPESDNAAGDGPGPGPAIGDASIVELPREEVFEAISPTAEAYMAALAKSGAVYLWGDVFLYNEGQKQVFHELPWPWRYPIQEVVVQASGHCLLTSRGEVFCFGNNFRLGGLPLGGGQIEPHRVGLANEATAIAEGLMQVCSVLVEGDIWCWGNNAFGGVGLPWPEVEWQLDPIRVDGLPPAAKVFGGDGSTCALTANGEAWCWGSSLGGVPPVAWHPELRFVDLAVGTRTACGITNDGHVFCSGESNGCELGTPGVDCFVDIDKAIATDDHGPEFDYAAWPAK